MQILPETIKRIPYLICSIKSRISSKPVPAMYVTKKTSPGNSYKENRSKHNDQKSKTWSGDIQSKQEMKFFAMQIFLIQYQ